MSESKDKIEHINIKGKYMIEENEEKKICKKTDE